MSRILSAAGLMGFWLPFLLFQAGCTVSASSTHTTEQKLVMGLSADYPPFEFKQAGVVVGFDVDVAQEIAKELGIALVIQDMDFSALVPSLQTGRIDIAMSGMTITEERKKNLDFSDPYYFSSFAWLALQETPFQNENDLKGKKVGVQLGTTMEKFAKEKAKQFPSVEVVSLGRNPMIIQEIKAKRLDGMISEDVQAAEFVHANPGLRLVGLAGQGEGYAIAFAKSHNEKNSLKEKVNHALDRIKSSGRLEEIKAKWVGKKDG